MKRIDNLKATWVRWWILIIVLVGSIIWMWVKIYHLHQILLWLKTL